MKIEIVIPCINLWKKYTRPAIESMQQAMVRAKAHGIDSHLILIDNASTDETPTEAALMENELFHYQKNVDRWGFQKSVNFGVNYGFANGADLAFVCNNDIIIHPEAIWRLVERMSKGDVGMATCMDISGEMTASGIEANQIGTLSTKEKEAVDDAPHPCFSAFMLSKECWEIVGELDEIFEPAYFEDNDYHYRMQLAEIDAIVHPPAMFFHFASRTQIEANEKGEPMISHGQFQNNRAQYMKKWGGLPSSEQYKHPYNEDSKSIKDVRQLI